MLPIKNISYLSPMSCNFWERCINSHIIGQGCSTPLNMLKKTTTGDTIEFKLLRLSIFPVDTEDFNH